MPRFEPHKGRVGVYAFKRLVLKRICGEDEVEEKDGGDDDDEKKNTEQKEIRRQYERS